jgi:hypothetical protein
MTKRTAITLVTLLTLCSSFYAEARNPEARNAIQPVTPDLPSTEKTLPTTRDEVAYLDNLIAVTEQTLIAAKGIRKQVAEYLAMQEKFIENTEDRELCYKLVKQAQVILTAIENHHLSQAFDPEFLHELSLFAKIGKKKGVPQA